MPYSIVQVRSALDRLPRVRLGHLPTPLEPLPRLSAALGEVSVSIKRDDCTGLAMGGNKTRQLEFTLGEAVALGADCIVQGAGSQSNHCRQTAAACARLGLDCYLVLCRDDRAPGAGEVAQGNLLLDLLFGANIRWTEAPLGHAFEHEKTALAGELRARGRRPYVIGGDRGKLLGAAAYVNQMCETAQQLDGTYPDAMYVCAAGATHAGLLLGARLLGLPFPIRAMAPIVWDYDVPSAVAETANALSAELGLPLEQPIRPGDVGHSEECVGPGYGILTREALAAIELVARTEGILLDPCYTGKAMSGLIDHVRRGTVRPGSRVLFVHTGGTPALFTYARDLLEG